MDVGLNAYNIRPDFGDGHSRMNITLNEYEKSVILTKAQDEIFLNLYSGKNPYGDFFEGTEELRRYLDNLVVTVSSLDDKTELKKVNNPKNTLSDNSYVYKLPEDLAFITLEQVVYSDEDSCKDGFKANVYPVTQDEFARVKDNPFRGPTKYKVLRVDRGERRVELIAAKGYTIGKYLMKYLRRPNPIVLVDLSTTNLSVNGVKQISECEMDASLHNLILDRAILLAVQYKSLGISNNNKNE